MELKETTGEITFDNCKATMPPECDRVLEIEGISKDHVAVAGYQIVLTSHHQDLKTVKYKYIPRPTDKDFNCMVEAILLVVGYNDPVIVQYATEAIREYRWDYYFLMPETPAERLKHEIWLTQTTTFVKRKIMEYINKRPISDIHQLRFRADFKISELKRKLETA